jgi:hypothetical protein
MICPNKEEEIDSFGNESLLGSMWQVVDHQTDAPEVCKLFFGVTRLTLFFQMTVEEKCNLQQFGECLKDYLTCGVTTAWNSGKARYSSTKVIFVFCKRSNSFSGLTTRFEDFGEILFSISSSHGGIVRSDGKTQRRMSAPREKNKKKIKKKKTKTQDRMSATTKSER